MASVEWLGTVRIGQLTGCTDPPTRRLLVDAQGWPLLNDTGAWGALGVDLGANTEHSDGRLYFFFGDVVMEEDPLKPNYSGNPSGSDLVAWTGDREVLRHGGHLGMGWNFILPYEAPQHPPGVQGQNQWAFCEKCHGLFYNGYPDKGVCPKDRQEHHGAGYDFVLPSQPTSVPGQPDWRFCGNCYGLFWAGDSNGFTGVCPKDGGVHDPTGWVFVLPFQVEDQRPTNVAGQGNWRFCGKCAGLFFNGYSQKGVCWGAPGGGFQLHAVLSNQGKFDPFAGEAPVGVTRLKEVPNGAFSYGGRVYVFAGIGGSREPRSGDPALGCYLFSKEQPHLAGPFRREFLFTPRIGWCPRDASRDRLESHEPLGYNFVLPHDIPAGPTSQANWRFCRKCHALFWDDDPTKGRCFRGGSHAAEVSHFDYVLSQNIAEDAENQGNWRRCTKCASIFFNGYATTGLCPAGGNHQPTEPNLVLPHPNIQEDANHQANWRFCTKCQGLVWTGQADSFPWVAPVVVRNSHHPGLPSSPYPDGLVMLAFAFAPAPGIRLAWMPLRSITTLPEPRLQDIRYYTGQASRRWSDEAQDAVVLLPHAGTYTHVSAAWLEGPKRWIVLYGTAIDETLPEFDRLINFRRPAMARIGSTLWDWSEEIAIFDPERELAYGTYMHWPGRDTINPDVSPNPFPPENPGWAYGIFILNRFTEWNASTRELGIYYLLSTSSPYQVHLVQTRLRLT